MLREDIEMLQRLASSSAQVLPPMSESELIAVRSLLPCPMPGAMLEILTLTAGLRGPIGPGFLLDWIDFSGRTLGPGLGEVFPFGCGVAIDGDGNLWVVDWQADSTEFGPIYFVCRDPPVVVLQCHSIQEFVHQIVQHVQPPHCSQLSDAKERWAFEVFEHNSRVMTYGEALESSDRITAEFAKGLDSSYRFVDLRGAESGAGFCWQGQGGSLRRCGSVPLFAYQERTRNHSWTSKLMGRLR